MFTEPSFVINQLNLEPGMKVADLGAGSGFFTLAIAPKVLPNGRVYAIEVQRELLGLVSSEAKRAHISNVDIIWGDVEKLGGTKIGDNLIDLAIVSNILFQIEDKETFLKEVRRILKVGGSVLLIDWSDSFNSMGPSESVVVKKTDAIALFEKHGLKFIRDIATGANHYGIIMKKE